MSYPLTIAAILTILVGIAHSYLGDRYILVRLMRRENLPNLFGSDWFTKRTLRFAWHLTTVAWFGLAVVMLILADEVGNPPPSSAVLSPTDPQTLIRSLAITIAGIFGISALITALASRGKHLAWPVFATIAALCWIAV
jgi:polyferredoxin